MFVTIFLNEISYKMKKKLWFILSPFLILFFSFIYHSIYKIWPNFLTSIFFPVNESIFEHNKMILLSYLTLSIIDYLIFKKDNVFINYYLTSIICLTLVTIIFFICLLFSFKYKR